MPLLTIAIGSTLILIGIGSYIGLGRTSLTAMIPAFLGLPLLALGYLALRPNRRKQALHVASAVVLIGFLGTVRGLVLVPLLAAQGQEIRPRLIVQAVTAVLCGVLLGTYMGSFISARLRRGQAGRREDDAKRLT